MQDLKRGLAAVARTVIGCAVSLLILFAVISLAGPAIGDAIGDATAPHPWKGVYEGRTDAEGDFKTAGDCVAWGRKQVESYGGSYKCGTDCTAERIGILVTYKCKTTTPKHAVAYHGRHHGRGKVHDAMEGVGATETEAIEGSPGCSRIV